MAEKTLTTILEVRENTKDTIAVTFQAGNCPSGILLDVSRLSKNNLGYLQADNPVIVETKGPLDKAGTEFIALYKPGQEEPLYTN